MTCITHDTSKLALISIGHSHCWLVTDLEPSTLAGGFSYQWESAQTTTEGKVFLTEDKYSL